MYGIAESSLAELIEDPLVGLVMKSDGVDRRCIELLFERIATKRVGGIEGLRPGFGQKEIKRCTIC
jgi:hypothetical protein